MLAVGITTSPIEFALTLKQARIKYSVNKVVHSIVIILGLENFAKVPRNSKKSFLIFDTLERLQTLKNLPVINDKNTSKILDKVKNLKQIDVSIVVNRNYIFEYLEKNKDKESGFLHIYNTNIYKISQKPNREAIRDLFLSLLNGSIKETSFIKDIKKIMPKKGKALAAAECLVDLTKTDSFKSMQICIQKARKANNDREIEAVAESHDVAAFDVRYLLSTLK